MDIHVQGDPRLHYRHNGYHRSKDDGLQFLSLEEKESILFFENTIDSLVEGFEEDSTETDSGNTHVEDPPTTPSPAVTSKPTATIAPSLTEHDIIDLVHSTPDSTVQDLQNLAVTPQAQFEIKPKRNPTESIPPAATFPDPYHESSHQPLPGSIPTPVIIASKIAEHNGPGSTSLAPSVLTQPRRSLESSQSPPSKLGPPTHAKPQRLPDNINMMLGNRDPTPQSIATAAVNMQERRSQMLANLPPSAHPLGGGEPDCVRNPPTRSVSFRDPTPDKSRMEALSMLGLTQGRAMSVNAVPVMDTKTEGTNSAHSSVNKFDVASNSAPIYNNIVNNASFNPSNAASQRRNSSTSVTSSEQKAKSEILRNNSYSGKTVITPSTTDTYANHANHANHDKKPSPAPAPLSAEVMQSDFNSYGGKTIVLNPTMSFRAEYVPSPSALPSRPDSVGIQSNSYGGRSRVISPSMQTDLPEEAVCRPRSHSHSPSSTITPSTHRPDLHSPTGVKSRVFPPAKADGQHTGLHYSSTVSDETQPDLHSHEAKTKALNTMQSDPVSQPVGRTKPATVPPMPAPRPQRPAGSLRPTPLEVRSRPPPKPSFRPQGISVQFSGKGPTDEARRDALRRLGLLKDTS